jgi:thiosulfate dehydrogenase [quinone] large subunit
MHLKPGRVPNPRVQAEIDRRTVVWTGLSTALVAGVTALTAGLTAAIGRALRTPSAGTRASLPSGPPPRRTPVSQAHSPASGRAAGTAIGPTSAVPVGQARSFSDPAGGGPAWVVHPSEGTFVAFNAVCTHAGCPVQYNQPSMQFVCPCHGGVYDARTGQVVAGPPPAPLQRIPLQVVAGQLRVDA